MKRDAMVLDTSSPFGTYPPIGLVRTAWRLASQARLPKGLRRYVRLFLGKIFTGPYDLEADGLKFRVYPSDNYDDRKVLIKGRLPEVEEHKLIKPFLSDDAVFVDVGANIGVYTVFAAHHGARVIALEPNAHSVDKLQCNIDANGLQNVTIVPTAAGPRDDVLELYSETSNRGFGTLDKRVTNGEWGGDWAPSTVKMRPLTTIVDEAGVKKIDVLKIDVEGFEDRVLLPFLRHAERSLWPRVILLETNCRPYWSEDCLTELANRSYKVTGRTNDNMVFELTA
ncbi:FkbM family methyltransferase [Roseibium alexandrii]|jgi:FkbM family methyltransferase|uniref:Methyltransferase, FkbM family n=2 Tax=Roseibium alexandrii TaxID=388408 RepID=A0A0M7AA40_9HYPH|nr:FkbM family methyltransferase [Roseibium alexandrii]EEE47393.1 methyltransferase, FkbM family [Roseibium alexandrii DFL-11]CTQ71487.1 methyltransferase, FkbM family [Roseibium alexandrii]